MGSCRNALEELVIEEAKGQINRLPIATQQQVNLSEVVAFALNRLPPMYATTQRGWIQQRKRAHDEYGTQIVTAVRQAMIGIRRDPLRQSLPLPPVEIETPARALAKLQRILNKDDLKWKDLSSAVAEALTDIRIKGAVSRSQGNPSRRSALDTKSYLKRSKSHQESWQEQQSNINVSDQTLKVAVEAREFDSYMSGASCGYTNTLENLVISIAQRQVQRINQEVRARITIEDVAAYALNRLPPMYATSDRGLHQQRQRAKAELANKIINIVREAIVKVGQTPNRLLPPLPFEKFDQEQEEALATLRAMLKREDINWRNVADIVEEVLTQSPTSLSSNWSDQNRV